MVVVPTSSVTESWHRNQENFSSTREKKDPPSTFSRRRVPELFKKLLKMSHLNLLILAFSTNFCPIKIDLSGARLKHDFNHQIRKKNHSV